MNENEIIKIHCNQCARVTKHLRLIQKVIKGSEAIDQYGPVSWQDTYNLLECCGCENISLQHLSWFSETDEIVEKNYPPPVSRRIPEWKYKLPHQISSLLDEIYNALHANSRRLVVMGARTIVDMVILDKVGDIGSFKEKLKALEVQGFIGKKNREFLTAALDAGSAAAHRGYAANPEEIGHVMDIVENLLEAVFVLEEAAENLKKSIPSRKTNSKLS